MPINLSSVAIAEKNKLATDSAFLVALEITIPGVATPVRIVRNNEDLFWRSETWTAFPFELDEVGDEAKGEVPQVVIRVANVSRVMEAYLQAYDLYCKTNGWSPITVTIYVVNTVNLYSGAELEDETGASWGPTYHGLSLADGQAFLRVQGVDLSPYADTDNRYMVKLHDSTGKTAIGYIDVAGGGEALGSEMVTGGAFTGWTGDNPDGWSLHVPENANNYVTEVSGKARIVGDGASGFGIYQVIYVTAGKLYKLSFNVDAASAGTLSVYVRGDGGWGDYAYYGSVSTTGNKTIYFTAAATHTFEVIMFLDTTGAAVDITIDDISIKEITDCAVDGVQIVSAQGGSDQDWASIESGFNYNGSSYTFEVFYAGEYETEVEHFFELKQPKTDSKWATFTLGAPNPSNMRFPRNRIMKNMCPFQPFKGARCGYSGVQTACNRTLTRCRELTNSERFGGFPGVGYGGVTVIK